MSERIPPFVRATLIVKGLTPPYLWAVVKGLRARLRPRPDPAPEPAPPAPEPEPATSPPEWEYVPEGWARPAGDWNVEAIAHAYREKWPSFLAAVEGPGPLGVNHEVPLGRPVPRDELDAQQIVLAFGHALARVAQGKSRISLLDWGGGPGHYAVLARALLPELELEYHSRDLPPLAALGRDLLPADSFSADDGCLDETYDLVMASGSIQYVEDWRATLAGLARATRGYLFVTRVPIALAVPSFVLLQRAQRYGYETDYLGWVLNRDELLEEARAASLALQREFVLPGWLSVPGAPEDPVGHRGFLLAPLR